MRLLFVPVILLCLLLLAAADIDMEEEKLPTKCHVCKHLVLEIQDELTRSARSKEVFRTGQIFQEQRKEIDYQRSEVRLNEALENACRNVLDYKVHKDKIKALRYEKKESVTFNTLKGLKKRGVKVDLGFPYEMWDSPDAEVTRLKSRYIPVVKVRTTLYDPRRDSDSKKTKASKLYHRKCELMVERYEDELIEWYWNHQAKNLTHWLCMERVLDPGEKECFNETEPEKEDQDDSEKKDTRDDKKKDQDNMQPKKKETETKMKKKEKSPKPKSQGERKTSSSKKKGSSPDREGDSVKIQRLIKEQAMKEEKRQRTRKNEFVGIMDERKRRKLQRRLRDIHDVDRLRRELRKIQMQEMIKDYYTASEPWEDDLDTRVPEDARKEIWRRRLDQMNVPEVLRKELIMRVLDTDEDFDDPHSRTLQDLRHRYIDEAEEIHNPEELKKRIDDLDTLSAIMAEGLDNRRDRRHPGFRDEL